jgi:hypothetical protein
VLALPLFDLRPDIVQHQCTQPLTVLHRIGHRDDASHRGAEQDELVEAKPLHEGCQVAGLVVIVVGAVQRRLALTMAPHIRATIWKRSSKCRAKPLNASALLVQTSGGPPGFAQS